MALSFQVHPQEFKRVITNAIEFGKDKPGDGSGSPYCMIHAEAGPEGNTLQAVTLSRRSAGRDWVDVEAPNPYDGAVEVLVTLAGKSNGQVVDTLEKLASNISTNNGVSNAKDSRLYVTIHHREKITVEAGGKLIGELPDAGSQTNHEVRFERVEQLLDLLDKSVFTGPTAFVAHTLAKVSKVRVGKFGADDSTVADIGQVDGVNGVAFVKVGDTFEALLSTVDRPVYAAGGPDHSGNGRPEHLLNDDIQKEA